MPEEKLDGRQDSLLARMKKLPLWQWGVICLFAAAFSSMSPVLMAQGGKLSRAQERAAQMGAACAGALIALVGIVLIILHFVKRRRE
jgi:hypothetical protein